MKDYFDKIYRKFKWGSYVYDIFELSPRVRRYRREILKVLPGQGNILDLCCGTGTTAILVAKNLPQCKIYGVDFSPHMLIRAKKKKAGLGLRNIEFQQGKSQNVSFPDSFFNAVIISWALHEMPMAMIKEVLTESHRLLKEEGKLIIVDFQKSNHWLTIFFTLFLKLFEPKYVFEFLNTDFSALLKSIGFIQVVDRQLGINTHLITATNL